jgi:hypothetical protein
MPTACSGWPFGLHTKYIWPWVYGLVFALGGGTGRSKVMDRRPKGREAETQIEEANFRKVGREPNRFKTVFRSQLPKTSVGQSSSVLISFRRVPGGLRTNRA